MDNCIFCKIVNGEIPSKKVYEDELVYVFEDIEPTAPIHYLAIPKEHISKLDEKRVEKVEDVVNIGDEIKVKVIEIDDKGRINLSKKDAE